MTKTDCKILVASIREKAEADAEKKYAQPGYQVAFPGPTIENHIDVAPTPIENKVDVKGAQVTVHTKELAEYVAKAVDGMSAQNAVLLAEVRNLVAAVLKAVERPIPTPVVHVAAPVVNVPKFPDHPPRAARIRLETDKDGNRTAIPEY